MGYYLPYKNELLAYLALPEKIDVFEQVYGKILRAYVKHRVEKFSHQDAKKGDFSRQM